MFPGEGLADLYQALQPIVDRVLEANLAERTARAAAEAAKGPVVSSTRVVDGKEAQPESQSPISLAIIGQPNVVSTPSSDVHVHSMFTPISE